MSRTTGPIEFTQLLIFLTMEPLPLSVDIGGFFWQRETYNPNSPVYTALALDELVESVSGSIGISLDAGAASAITVWVNSVPIGDVEPGETLEIPFFDIPVSVVVTPFVDLFDFRVTRIGEFTGELLGECPFTLNSLTVDFTVETDEEPVGECFWTDLLNVTEDCGGESPDPEPPEVINATGVLDPEFAVVAFFNNTVDLIKQLSNGNIVVLGRFSFGMSTSSRGHLLLDPYADVALGGAINMGPNSPSAAAILDAGDIYYIAGQWGGFDQNYLRARVSATGAPVTSGFSLPTLQNIPSSAVFWPSDGRIAIAGAFTHINSVPMSRLGVINPDGSLYDGFSDPAIGGSLDFRIVLAALTDGSLIVTTPGGVRRYLPDGTQDASFSFGYDGISTSMAETPDGGFVAFAYNSDTWPTIFVAKMDATGAPWPGFTPLAIATGTASLGQLCVYPDGRILAAAGSVYRILPDGSLDPEWVVPTLGGARGVSLQADGKVLVCGSFSSVNGQARSCIARLM